VLTISEHSRAPRNLSSRSLNIPGRPEICLLNTSSQHSRAPRSLS